MVAVESLAVTGAVAPCGPEGGCIRTTVVSLLKKRLAATTGPTDRLDACDARNPYADPMGGHCSLSWVDPTLSSMDSWPKNLGNIFILCGSSASRRERLFTPLITFWAFLSQQLP
jgi:hypothetical protein